MGRIILLSGPPGAGKTTVAGRLAAGTEASHSLNLRTADFFGYVRKGFVQPWRPEADNQNLVVMHALAASAVICARGGYEVFADGIFRPPSLQPWIGAARDQGLELHCAVLAPDEPTAISRALARTGPGELRDRSIVELIWRRFQGYEFAPGTRIDTSGQSVDETVAAVREGLAAGRFRLV